MRNVKNSVIVYYSWVGSTETVAEEIHRRTNFDMQKIEETTKRRFGKFAGAAMAAVIGLKSRIKPMDFELQDYENVFFGAQVWAGRTAPAVNNYLKKASFKNKNVWLFLTKGDEKIPQQVIDSITKRIEKKGGRVVDSMAVTSHWEPKTNIPLAPEEVQEPVEAWLKKEGFL
ncbi:hypothetical protein C6Y45_07610 [Alkalicoccus saliphilus]|uniref:Flavodoxin-like domain-containing protein n=1 Tax=Alkalicoccus saliphilus TaxID=200989 RepID=A0A2T4U6L8_9BACI|nr:hypothetical protein C6Y45_07610 [Alkalicoccus saliphilus]